MSQKTAIAKDIITIDGPAGAGKSTVSKLIARRLCYTYLDTGAMYRAVAVCVQREGIDPQDDPSLKRLCAAIDIEFQGEGDRQRVYCQGEDVTEKIREPKIGWLASTVSTRRPVREAMVNLQRKIGSRGRVVAEGRDTGTIVFPGAQYKFFLLADSQERTRRRFQELITKGNATTMEEVDREMRERDQQDSSRELAPLRPAPDARLIDSTNSSPEQVAGQILRMIQEREETGNG
jgi:cytidylate kinase